MRQQGSAIGTEKRMRGKGMAPDGFFHGRASAKWSEHEMNFGKWEMAAPVDVHSGKRRNTAVRQFPDVITGSCSRAKRPGLENPEILLYSTR